MPRAFLSRAFAGEGQDFAGATQDFAGTIWDFAAAEGQNISNKLDDLIDARKQP